MTRNVKAKPAMPPVAPLLMEKPEGGLYVRPDEVEASLGLLLGLPATEVARRARIDDPDSPEYVRSECVLYFVRRLDIDAEERALHELHEVLLQRVLRAVPVPRRRIAGSGKVAESSMDLEIRDVVLQKFHELVCGDRQTYDKRLDFYECRFNQALAYLRLTSRRDVQREESHYEPVAELAELSDDKAEGDNVFTEFLRTLDGETAESGYRNRLDVAISSLPTDERRVIELLLRGIPIDPTDEGAQSIRKLLGCAEKTVRNRRDRAHARLRQILRPEDEA